MKTMGKNSVLRNGSVGVNDDVQQLFFEEYAQKKVVFEKPAITPGSTKRPQ